MKRAWLLCAVLLVASGGTVLLTACGGSSDTEGTGPRPTSTRRPSSGGEDVGPPEGRLARDVIPRRYSLSLAVDPRAARFTGVAEIDVELPHRMRDIYLHGRGLDVAEVSVSEVGRDATDAEWSLVEGREDEGLAHIRTARPVGPGSVRVRVTYGAAFDQALTGLYRLEHEGQRYAYTQMEPLGARRAFPCFDDPSFKTPYDLTLVIHEDDRAVANARERSNDAMNGQLRRVRFATTEPIPTYLVAFAVGPFDIVEGPPVPANDVRREPLPLRGVAPRGEGAQLAHALEHTGAILTQLEGYFGVAYPFDKLDLIAVPDFAAGAMENPGAVTFRSRLLLLSEDAPLSQQRGFAYVTAHELAHMWFGNLVTTAWWNDLWLNEAFATWMETQTIEATFPEMQPQIAEMEVALSAMGADSLASARRIRQPIESEHDIHNAFDSITYSKGNAMLAMFESYLTPEVFQRGVRAYVRAHAEGNATASDLIGAISEAAGRDLSGPFESFLNQPGVPLVEVTPTCEGETGSLALRQSRYLPLGSRAERQATWQIPFCARYRAGGEVRRTCTLLTEAEGTMPLEGGCADWVMPNAGGVGYYRWTLPASDLETLRRRGLSELGVREAMSYADSIRASFAAGNTTYADAMSALRPLIQRDERALATAPMGLVSFGVERALSEPARVEAARRAAGRLYRNPTRALGWRARRGEDPERTLYRVELLTFLARVAQDRSVRRDGGELGRAYLGLRSDNELHPDAVDPDLVPLVVELAVQQGGERVLDHVLAKMREASDPATRYALLQGAASITEPALRERVLAMTLEDRFPVSLVFRVYMSAMRQPENIEPTFAWITEHYDAIVARIGPAMAGYLPYSGSMLCSADGAARVRAFFGERVAQTVGGPRNLEASVEEVELCAARVEHARESVQAYFR